MRVADAVVDTNPLSGGIHYDVEAQLTLGRSFAHAMSCRSEDRCVVRVHVSDKDS